MKGNAGMTLMELLVSVMILALLAVALGTGMDAAMKAYEKSQFESDSSALAGILDTALWDLISFATDLHQTPEGLAVTNPEWGAVHSYMQVRDGLVCLGREGRWVPLVNTGAYPELAVAELDVRYLDESFTLLDGRKVEPGHGGVVYITCRMISRKDPARFRDAEFLIRPWAAGQESAE